MHEGHDIEMFELGNWHHDGVERFGPYCHTCKEDMRFFLPITDEDIDRASQWWKENKHKFQDIPDPS